MGRETPVAALATRSARRRKAALRAIGAVVPAAVAAALSPARDHVAPQTIALVLVLVVTIAAAVGRRAVAVAAGLSAAIGFDYFHTRPYGSLSITRSEDVVFAEAVSLVCLVHGSPNTGPPVSADFEVLRSQDIVFSTEVGHIDSGRHRLGSG